MTNFYDSLTQHKNFRFCTFGFPFFTDKKLKINFERLVNLFLFWENTAFYLNNYFMYNYT